MNLSDLNNLDLKNIVSAPAPVKAVLLALVFLGILVAGWFLVWSEGLNQLKAAEQEEVTLRGSYTTKKGQAFHYEAHKRRLAEVEQSLAALLRQLPNRSQMDALLTDINQAGVGRGLDFELFRPGTETLADFYATLPVAIKVSGSYHDMGGFVTDLAKLSRIVTVHDISLLPVKDAALGMEARIQTYRYLDESELAAARKQKQGQKGAGK